MSAQPEQWLGALVGAGTCLACVPVLAPLSVTAADRDDARWWGSWRAVPHDRRRWLNTAGWALLLGGAGGAAAGWSALLPAFVALALAGAPLAVIDLEQHRLPNRLMYPLALAAAVLLALAAARGHHWAAYLRAAEAAAAVFAVLYLVLFLAPRSFGLGDVRLGGVLGGYLGWFGWLQVYYGIFAGFLLGTAVSVVLLATRRAGMKTALPFGPMLLLGAVGFLAVGWTPGG